MDKYNLKGSPSRDAFKFWHKQKRESFYGGDIDFFLIEKVYVNNHPHAKIIALLDFKTNTEKLTFVEVAAYEHFRNLGFQIFIIHANVVFKNDNSVDLAESFQRFAIYKYIAGDWKPRPPRYELKTIKSNITPDEYWQWETNIRHKFRERFTQSVNATRRIKQHS